MPRTWVDHSVAPHVSTGPRSADGLAWHLWTLAAGGRHYREYEANGNGGPFLIVLSELDLAIVFTVGDYNRYGVWRHLRDEARNRIITGNVHGTTVRAAADGAQARNAAKDVHAPIVHLL